MIDYEFHVTLRDPEAISIDWKATTFQNLIENNEIVKEETLLTDNAEFESNADAYWYLFNVTAHFKRNIIRSKIERPFTKDKYAALYHEAHFKVSDWWDLGESFLLKSVNKANGAKWYTMRYDNAYDLLGNYNYLVNQPDFKTLVIEKEIESVILDTNIELDKFWELGIKQ